MRTATLSILVLFHLACTKTSEHQNENASITISEHDPIAVTFYTSSIEKLTYPVKAIGKIRSAKSSNIIFERQGIIESIEVRNGAYVLKGTVIAKLRNKKELLDLQSAEIDLDQALSLYENELLRIADSTHFGAEWLQIKKKILLNVGVSQAKMDLEQAKFAYEQTIVKAPFSGITEGIEQRPGEFISTNDILGSIYDPVNFELACDILEYDILKIQKGMSVIVIPHTNNKSRLAGYVTEINPAINSKGVSRIIIAIQDQKDLIPGITASVEIKVTDEPTIVIPSQAVIKRSERHVVFNIENGLAKWNYVTLGKDNGNEVQILEGLKEDMHVIITNNLRLAHDSPVQIMSSIE